MNNTVSSYLQDRFNLEQTSAGLIAVEREGQALLQPITETRLKCLFFWPLLVICSS